MPLDRAGRRTQAEHGAYVLKVAMVHTGDLEIVRGLFWHPASGTDPAEGAYVHYGFTGTGMWINPTQDRWAVLLANELYYTRDRGPLADVRNTFRALALT